MKDIKDSQIVNWIASPSEMENDKAFKLIYNQKYKLVERFIVSNNGSSKDAKDIFQEALIVFYHQCKSSDFKLTCSVQSYLYSISRNLWMNVLRKSARTTSITDFINDTVTLDEDHFKVLIKKERAETLKVFINKMQKECSEILMLYYYKKMRMAEIVSQLNLSNEQVVRNKKSKCMKKLRSLIFRSEEFNY